MDAADSDCHQDNDVHDGHTVKGHTVKNTKKVLLATLAAGSMLALAACSGGSGGGDSSDGGGDGGLIGVAMPTKSSERWIQDGDAVKAAARGARASPSTSSTQRTTSPPRSRRSRT